MQRAKCMVLGHRWERVPDDYGAYPLFRCERCAKVKEFPMQKALVQRQGVRGALIDTAQVLGAALALAAVGGLIGFAIVGTAAKGFGWGMIVAGGLAGLLAGNSGSPTVNLARGRWGRAGNYWSESSPLPQSPLQIALGGMIAFAGGLAVALVGYT